MVHRLSPEPAGSPVVVWGLSYAVVCGILVPQPGIEPMSPALGCWGNPRLPLVIVSLRCYFFSLSSDYKVLIPFFQCVFINEAVACHRGSEPGSESLRPSLSTYQVSCNPGLLQPRSPALQADSLPSEPPRKPLTYLNNCK